MRLDLVVAATPEANKIHRGVLRRLVRELDDLLPAGRKGETLVAAGLSLEMYRKWRDLKSSPTLRSLVSLTKVLDKRLSVRIVPSSASVLTLLEEEGPMPDDLERLIERLTEMTADDRQRVQDFIAGIPRHEVPRPPALAPARPGRGQ